MVSCSAIKAEAAGDSSYPLTIRKKENTKELTELGKGSPAGATEAYLFLCYFWGSSLKDMVTRYKQGRT